MRGLPDDLPVAVFVVQHMWRASSLASILQRYDSRGRVIAAQDGEMIRENTIYVGVPNYHLVLENSRVRLRKTPRENYHRPAIDVLFRSAAREYGPKVVGVILTSSMEDGTSGPFAIKTKGGVTVVQDPTDALVPEMPMNALEKVDIDYCLPLIKIPQLIERLANEPVMIMSTPPPNDVVTAPFSSHVEPDFVCPECDGPLTRYQEGTDAKFCCKIGHRFSLQSLTEAYEDALERGLWTAIRTLSNRAAIQRERAVHFRKRKNSEQANTAVEIANQAESDIRLLYEIIERI
jgi:two-component system, chemotaxis family, protein-glutamate methylesterase/glutaminase